MSGTITYTIRYAKSSTNTDVRYQHTRSGYASAMRCPVPTRAVRHQAMTVRTPSSSRRASSLPSTLPSAPAVAARSLPTRVLRVSGTARAYGGTCLRVCYAMSGTAISYGGGYLRVCYAMSGTEIAYGDPCLCPRYAMPGSDMAVRVCVSVCVSVSVYVCVCVCAAYQARHRFLATVEYEEALAASLEGARDASECTIDNAFMQVQKAHGGIKCNKPHC
eukprot:1678002-Rhodomonas_salina.5